jgi:hypothetical protein
MLSDCPDSASTLSGRTVRSGAGAAVGIVAVGVDMHATLSAGIVAGDVP